MKMHDPSLQWGPLQTRKRADSVYCQGTVQGSWSHVVRWGKKTCMTMNEMLAFGIEIIHVGVWVPMCVCVHLHMRL